MKSIALGLMVSLLFHVIPPVIAHASGLSRSSEAATEMEPDNDGERSFKEHPEEIDGAAEDLERIVRLLYRKNVVVMSRGNLNLSRLKRGWYAYVVYEYNHRRGTVTTKIVDIDEKNIVFRTSFDPGTPREIRHDDVLVIVAAQKRGDLRSGWDVETVMNRLMGVPRIRFKAPSVVKSRSKTGWVFGRLAGVNQDTLMIAGGPSSRVAHRVPLSAFTDLEFYKGQRRHTGKGLLIGLVLGLMIGNSLSEEVHDPGYYHPDVSFAQGMEALRVYSVAIGCGTFGALIGYGIKTDHWIDAPFPRLNLNVAPTRNRGLRAALSFDF